MNFSLFNRYAVFVLCLLITLVSFICLATMDDVGWLWPVGIVALALSVVGIVDMRHSKLAVRRNYPVIGNIRYLFLSIRPEIRQYLLESDDEEVPFSYAQRDLVYARVKQRGGEKPFGTLMDVYKPGYEFIAHSVAPVMPPADPESFRITVGGPQCRQPYSLSVFNISAMSFGALSANAIRALNKGALLGNFAHDTGEGSISPYHREFGGDLIWEIGSGYFGCRKDDGTFDEDRFADQAKSPQVKMIEIKLSQGAKPGHGGILPKDKLTAEIASTRGVPMGQDCVSPARHTAFSTPRELMGFIARLRELSDGKPVGFKLCVGHYWEFMAIGKAMIDTGIYPDFIVVDGSEGGTGAAPKEFTDYVGLPMREGLLAVHNTLVGLGIRDRIRIGVSGKIVSAFDIASVLAIGADWANSARGYMMALGCIQAQSCHTNRCPVGVATQDPTRQRALIVGDKAERVYNFHHNTLKALAELIAAAGLDHPGQLTPQYLLRRVSCSEIRLYSQDYHYLKPGELLGDDIESPFIKAMWEAADPDSFAPKKILNCA